MTKKVIMIPPQPVTGEVSTTAGDPVAPATNILINRLTIAAADTEYSFPLTTGLIKLELMSQVPGAAEIKFSFTAGQSGTDYGQIPVNTQRELSGLSLTGKTLYYQSPVGGAVLEVLQYT